MCGVNSVSWVSRQILGLTGLGGVKPCNALRLLFIFTRVQYCKNVKKIPHARFTSKYIAKSEPFWQ